MNPLNKSASTSSFECGAATCRSSGTTASQLIDRYTTTKGCKTLPRSAKDICCDFIQRYAEEAQDLAEKYRTEGDNHKRRLFHHISISAFAVVRGESDKIHQRGASLEVETRKYMLGRINEALQTLREDYASINAFISAKHPLRKTLNITLSSLYTAIGSFRTAQEDLKASLM